jgi:branched-chain amino acid aminotransferase
MEFKFTAGIPYGLRPEDAERKTFFYGPNFPALTDEASSYEVCLFNSEDVGINPMSHSVQYGSGGFEGLRYYLTIIGLHRAFEGAAHSKRLIYTADLNGIQLPMTAHEISMAQDVLMKAFPAGDYYVRPYYILGEGTRGLSKYGAGVYIGITAWKWKYANPPQGLRIASADYLREIGKLPPGAIWRKASPNSMPVTTKAAANYVLSTRIKDAAVSAKFDDGLVTSDTGNNHIVELSAANLFAVMQDNTIVTPISGDHLDGITRQAFVAIARNAGFRVEQRRMQIEELAGCKEFFVTGTALEAAQVASVRHTNGLYVFQTGAGTIGHQLAGQFHEIVRREGNEPILDGSKISFTGGFETNPRAFELR